MRSSIRALPFAILVLLVTGGAATWIGFAPPPPAPPDAEQIVLLHGLGRTKTAMWYLERRLEEAGYRVHNIGYRSLDEDMGEIVAHVAEKISDAGTLNAPKLHFVAHSLGGLVARAYIAKHRPANLGRVVLLAPPNGGSPVIDRLRAAGISNMPIGPAGRALGAGDDDLPARLPKPDYPVGVIAGSADLLVPADRTRLDGMADFFVVDTGHAWMRNDSEAADQAIHFLRHGKFKR